MRILVTGATGSLGSNVIAAALEDGLDVRALVRDPTRFASLADVDLVAGDALDAEAVRRASDGCAVLFHLVNVNITHDWVQTTARLLDAAIDACKSTGSRLVFPGNVWVFGRGARGARLDEAAPHAPCSQMGRAREAKEARLRDSGVRFVLVRLPEFYGPHVQTLTGPPLQRIARKEMATWFGPGSVEVEFVYMPDAARALLTIGLADGVDGEVFHLPGAAAITPRAIFALAREVAGGGGFRAVPAWLVRAAGLVSPEARAFRDILHLWTHPILLDGSKAQARFPALRPTPYRDGLATTIEWLRSHPDARMYY